MGELVSIIMDYVLHNLRLRELVQIVNENKRFYEDFVEFLTEEGYSSVLNFIQESSDEKSRRTISRYLTRESNVKLYDGILRPYTNSKAKWYFLAWLLRDAATQRLQPLLSSVPGKTDVERKTYMINELRKFVIPLFPEVENWEWPAVSEVMLARLEGSRRSLKGTLFEELIRRSLRELIVKHHLDLTVSKNEIRLHDETYDVQVIGENGSILFPVKTRETMGGGHALLFTRDIYKSILIATQNGFTCIPVVIAESWGGDLSSLESELFIYIPVNPNQIAIIEPLLMERLEQIVSLLKNIL